MRTYPEIGQSIGQLVEKKQAAYGDSFGKSGEVMRILYPGGIPPEKLDDALTVVRVIDKLFRIATDKDALGESPWKDIAGYAILSVQRQESLSTTKVVERVIPISAYVEKGGCGVCDFQEEGKLHKWHCVFRDPNHYEDYRGLEVHTWP